MPERDARTGGVAMSTWVPPLSRNLQFCHRLRRSVRIPLSMMALVAVAATASAQSLSIDVLSGPCTTPVRLEVVVRDMSTLISGATVVVRASITGQSFTTITNASGRAVFALLPSGGSYEVT